MAQAYIRPIEIGTTAKDLTVDGAPTALPMGTYASILPLLKELQDVIQAVNADISIYIDSSHIVNFVDAGAGGCAITAVDEALAVLLGDVNLTITVPAGGSVAMAYPPQYCWFPTYQTSNRDRFSRRHNSDFVGTTAQTGRVVGVAAGPAIYYRQFDFAFEPPRNVYVGGSEDSFSIGGNTYYPYQTRCFEHFISQARIASPAASTNPTPKGCWYVAEFENYEGTSPTWSLPDAMGTYNGIGIDAYDGSVVDRYLYCHLDPGGARQPEPSLPAGFDHYSVSFLLNSATPPTWTAP